MLEMRFCLESKNGRLLMNIDEPIEDILGAQYFTFVMG